jgi:hypothetical protein
MKANPEITVERAMDIALSPEAYDNRTLLRTVILLLKETPFGYAELVMGLLTVVARRQDATAAAFRKREITLADAKVFFTYQHSDKVAEALAKRLNYALDDILECRIEADGNVSVRFAKDPKTHFYLPETTLIGLAVDMGWEDWTQPNYAALPAVYV